MSQPTFKKSIMATLLLLPMLLLNTVFAAENHVIKMLNTAPEGEQATVNHNDHSHDSHNHDGHDSSLPHNNVFSPDILEIKPGDSVTFVPTDTGHNSAAKRGMVPEGVERWNSPLDKEFTVTLTEPGVYGYICVPHYEVGMVGLIVVRENPTDEIPNLKKAKKVRHPGMAKKAFKALFARLAAQDKHTP